MFTWWRLTKAQREIMRAIAAGNTLKSHRYLDGTKVYKMWTPDVTSVHEVAYDDVQRLLDWRLITTNQKFPAATFLLTNKGQQLVRRWGRGLRGITSIVKFDS